MEKNANSLVQTESILVHLSAIPAHVWAIGFCLLLAVLGAIHPLVCLCAILAILAARHHIKRVEIEKEARARAASYANLIGPIVVGSETPEENVYDVHEKAEAWREKLRLSGNPYWKIIPIVEFPYQPLLYATGQLSAGFSIYRQEVAEKQYLENLDWYNKKCPAEIKTLFASAVLPQPTQTPEAQ
jgi:hypothetical protein